MVAYPWRMIVDNRAELAFDLYFEKNGSLKINSMESSQAKSKSEIGHESSFKGKWEILQSEFPPRNTSDSISETSTIDRHKSIPAICQIVIEIELPESNFELEEFLSGQTIRLQLNPA